MEIVRITCVEIDLKWANNRIYSPKKEDPAHTHKINTPYSIRYMPNMKKIGNFSISVLSFWIMVITSHISH